MNCKDNNNNNNDKLYNLWGKSAELTCIHCCDEMHLITEVNHLRVRSVVIG